MQNRMPALNQCLKPLLKQLKWDGDDRTLYENLPYISGIETIEQFQNVMKNLGYKSNVILANQQKLDDRLFPCLFLLPHDDSPKVLLERTHSGFVAYDSQQNKKITIPKFLFSEKKLVKTVYAEKEEDYNSYFLDQK